MEKVLKPLEYRGEGVAGRLGLHVAGRSLHGVLSRMVGLHDHVAHRVHCMVMVFDWLFFFRGSVSLVGPAVLIDFIDQIHALAGDEEAGFAVSRVL